jgi:putative CocE/NonD family hydrolase
MRDGVKLFTYVIAPTDTSERYPFLLQRTPYSAGASGGWSSKSLLMKSGYIRVSQDVRGRYLSEGEFVNMRPHIDRKQSSIEIDESTDTHDTIEWLLANIPSNNGRVGMFGISYPGFYSSAGMIDGHPALVAVSPQAPIADWWYDDFHHHGALFLPHTFTFLAYFGQARPKPTTEWGKQLFTYDTQDGYQFFLNLGPLRNVNERFYKDRIAFWNDICNHPNYDEFWRNRDILPHLKKVAPAVLTVGGWYDAEDLYGALKTFRAVEKQNSGVVNSIVMGPWGHGGWAYAKPENLGGVDFGSNTGVFFSERIQFPFFEHFLKGRVDPKLAKATMFETGANRWRTFPIWPPANMQKKSLYFREERRLSFEPPAAESDACDQYVSDPDHPVPYVKVCPIVMDRDYMIADQRFASKRDDVLSYQSDALMEDVTLAGDLCAHLIVSTTGTDSDWVVKLIDVFPADAPDYPNMRTGQHMAGYQMMVRSEVIRGRFRNSNEHPEPFVPNQPTKVDLPLQDVLHTFKKGHRIMVQVQSTWFPLVDRNPQKYVDNIYLQAEDKDFIKATQKVFRSREHASSLEIGILPNSKEPTVR